MLPTIIQVSNINFNENIEIISKILYTKKRYVLIAQQDRAVAS